MKNGKINPYRVLKYLISLSLVTIVFSANAAVDCSKFGSAGDAVTCLQNEISNLREDILELKNIKQKPGVKGSTGTQGLQGKVGPKGEKGDKGIPGEKGEQGFQGNKGPKGDKGLKGERGAQGSLGRQGIRGRDGNPASICNKVIALQGRSGTGYYIGENKGKVYSRGMEKAKSYEKFMIRCQK